LFGAILEQAGFSTSKKLVGLFYGYDFTVLRVFFTAGIVAMIGVMALSHYGLLDVNLIFINPTFLWSALVGGVIMGLGFILGGFCPGTSICAAAIGKIDAMIFIAGAFLGVFIFAEGFPLFEDLYIAANWGNPTMFETLNISQNLFAFILVAFALIAFVITSIIENKVNGISSGFKFTPYSISLATIGALLLVSTFLFPNKQNSLVEKAKNSDEIKSLNAKVMPVDELAYRLLDKYDKQLQIIDFRAEEDFKKLSLPNSTIMTLDNLFEKEPAKFLSYKHKINLIVADNELEERKIAYIMNELGYKRIRILEGGLNEFKSQILDYQNSSDNFFSISNDTKRFRISASNKIAELIKNNKSSGVIKKEQKRIIGGC
jgi:rhodanese-related sulfurtransferase